MSATDRLFDDWVSRRHPVTREAVTVRGGRIYILPTRNGRIFALLILVMLLGSNHYANSMAFLLTFLLAGLGLNAMWRTAGNLKGLFIQPGGAAPVFAGQRAHFVHEIGCPERHARPALLLMAEGGQAVRFSVAGGGRATVELPVPSRQRGLLHEGRLILSTDHPLGLFRAWTYADFDGAALVYPSPASRPPPLPAIGDAPAQDRPVAEARGQDTDQGDLAGLQAYRPGDPPRRVAWKAVARTGKLVSKAFSEPEGGDEAWADWFALGGHDPEERLSILCRWLLDSAKAGRPCGLRMPGTLIPPDIGDTHLSRCLERFALYGH